MSFMFNPYPYQENSALNKPRLSQKAIDSIVSGGENIAGHFSKLALEQLKSKSSYTICLDGFISAKLDNIAEIIRRNIASKGIKVRMIDIEQYYKSSKEIESMLESYLPSDKKKDPILLFGKIFHGSIEDYFDIECIEQLKKELVSENNKVTIVHGIGAASGLLRDQYDTIAYFDVTPFEMTLRIRRGESINIGDKEERNLRERFRRFYYCDYEVAYKLRDDLLLDKSDFYIESNSFSEMKLMPKETFNEIMSSLAKYPYRCRPVYNEGVWGGFYPIKYRNLPNEMKNCAWVFDLIPNEVSILVQAGKHLIDFPYLTFVKKEGEEIMGKECLKQFKGIFPIRCNYDDTYHSNGNMSIQVHPYYEYAKKAFGEDFQQDEAYYIVATGHDAKTYLGLQEDCDVDEFFNKVKQSEIDKKQIDHDKYVNSVPSIPGRQILLPGGTIHSSGRNQMVLELGSCTMGSMTFKLYDYVRLDFDGNPRPIHSYYGREVLQTDRRKNWVETNLVQEPVLVKEGEGWKEYQVGNHSSMFYKQHRYEFSKSCEGNVEGWFHILALVDGEKVRVECIEDPERSYEMEFLDIIVVPKSVGKYRITNLSSIGQPIIVYKVLCKPEYEKEKAAMETEI